MPAPTGKALKRLAKECRAAGIKVYKGPDFELTFTDEAPVKQRITANGKPVFKGDPNTAVDDKFESDSLTQDQLLYWSTGGMPGFDEEAQE